jgi:tetratricopeptide (TPR) repeat protein
MGLAMDQIQQRIDDLKRFLDSRLDQTSSKASRFLILSLILILILLVLGSWLFNRYTTATNDRLDQLEATIKSSGLPGPSIQSPTQGAQSDSNSEINSLKARLASLETLQEAMVSTSKGALEQMNFVFAITAAFLAMFSIFLAYRQIKADTSREKYDSEMTTLVESSRKNIDFISTLITTLEQSYSYRKEVELRIKDLDKQISEVEKYKEKTELSLQEKIARLNEEAFTLFRGLDRENFKSEDNKGKLETFYVNMNTLEQMADVSGLLSPFSFFLRALHFFNVTQYQPAQEDLKKAHKSGFREVAQKTPEWYGDEVAAELDKQLNRMLVDCSYQLGITHYNLGEYRDARERFDEAFRSNPLDFRSRSYIPELKFFDPQISFNEVIAEFESVERELKTLSLEDREKIDWSAAMASLKMREGNCYLPKLFTIRGRERYRSEEHIERAVGVYWEAFDEAQKTRKPNLTEIFTRFSLAQALEQVGAAEWRNQRPHDLFHDVFNEVRNQIVLKSEPILLVLLNYTIAICAKRANVSGENPRTYLARAREQLQRVPAQVRIFSPITKINLTRQEILWEIEEFEKSLS